LNPKVPAYYGNRSFCYIKTEYYGSALEDANKAIELDKKYIKVRSHFLRPHLTLSCSYQVEKHKWNFGRTRIAFGTSAKRLD